uniref:CSON006548 protein n=1 Tax=Culicoides sonorensis TaxID=179676 RepID=A0A336MTF8_CULSO
MNRKPHTCEFCNESFKHNSTLRFHLQKVHNKGPNYICSQCGREFFSPGSLQYHEACHLDVYTVPCPVPYCDKLCKSKIHLKKHQMDMHSQKPYPCPICGKVFSSAKYLKQHKFSHQPKSYFCPVCPRSFSVSHSMRKHVTDKHPEYEMPPSGTQLKHVQWNKVEDS